MRKALAAIAVACVLAWIWGSAVAKVDEPAFVLEERDGDFELRKYGSRAVAETRVVGSWEQAGNEGFRRLAGYIFGKNAGGAKAPTPTASGVREGERADASADAHTRVESRKLAMTAPVGERANDGAWLVTFTMPEGETLATLPRPHDERVLLRELPPIRVAVVRFSGRWTEQSMRARTDSLRAWLERRSLHVVGEPEVNRYDPPWIPWFMRRNEIWLTLAEG